MEILLSHLCECVYTVWMYMCKYSIDSTMMDGFFSLSSHITFDRKLKWQQYNWWHHSNLKKTCRGMFRWHRYDSCLVFMYEMYCCMIPVFILSEDRMSYMFKLQNTAGESNTWPMSQNDLIYFDNYSPQNNEPIFSIWTKNFKI